jgi:ABC-2 type transport system ATP-binding protein
MSERVIVADGVTRHFGDAVALDGVSFALRRDVIHGLLGRNGAGKTTLMQILTGQQFPTTGTVEVFGASPAENDRILADVCFVRENLRYPDWFKVNHALAAAALLFPNWDEAYAQSLVDDFALPRKRQVKKLSRGMLSAVGVIIGLASRAPITFFDEPYLGLDAVARQLFYDRLLADYAEHPRTIVLSTHLIDEVADLVEHVLLLDRGRLVVDESTERLRSQAVTVTGATAAVTQFAQTHTELHRSTLGTFARATVRADDVAGTRAAAQALGLQVEPVSLQQLVVSLTGASAAEHESKESSR